MKVDTHRLPRYIAVEGPIGVGKTTLAKQIGAAFKYPVLLEPVTDNPFLDRFYREGRHHALPTQLYFLLHRAQQMGSLGGDDLVGQLLVSDFVYEKDDLFARLTLEPSEYQLYKQIHDNLSVQPPTPDLVIYLQAPASVLLNRIRARGIGFESHIDRTYLDTLIDAYTEYFHFYDQAPLLIVNAAEIDFAHNARHFEALIDQVIAMEGMRQYFNPNPTLL